MGVPIPLNFGAVLAIVSALVCMVATLKQLLLTVHALHMFPVYVCLVVQNFILIGGAEAQRNAESDDEKRKYPGESSCGAAFLQRIMSCLLNEVCVPAGGAFDPLGWSKVGAT